MGGTPARYLALRWGSRKHRMSQNFWRGDGTDVSLKEGGNQIEYPDEDPEIRRIFEAELAKRGVESKMAQFFEKSSS